MSVVWATWQINLSKQDLPSFRILKSKLTFCCDRLSIKFWVLVSLRERVFLTYWFPNFRCIFKSSIEMHYNWRFKDGTLNSIHLRNQEIFNFRKKIPPCPSMHFSVRRKQVRKLVVVWHFISREWWRMLWSIISIEDVVFRYLGLIHIFCRIEGFGVYRFAKDVFNCAILILLIVRKFACCFRGLAVSCRLDVVNFILRCILDFFDSVVGFGREFPSCGGSPSNLPSS